MRQLMIQVPRGCGAKALAMARAHEASNLACMEAHAGDKALDLLLVHVSNGRVEPLLGQLQQLPELHVSLLPTGVIALRPPASDAPSQVLDVGARSPIEVFLGGLQSVGSWKGFLGYAAAAAFVVWIGLFTNTVYLLTAAMLIAPFAGPAMNAALATARGDASLLGRSLARYTAGLLVCSAIAYLMSLTMRQEIATSQMVEASFISSVAFVLPLVAGAAGALNLCQSDRSSLVSGAATGMLVAASLAPPAGLVGMAAAIGQWDMAKTGLFVLVLQVVGINVSGAIVFHLFGLSSKGVRYSRGQRWVSLSAWAASAVLLGGLVTWQQSHPPALLHSTQAQRAAASVQKVIEDSALAQPVEVDARFTRANIPGQNSLLIHAYVQVERGADTGQVRRQLTQAIQAKLAARSNVTPLVDISVFEPGPSGQR